MAKAMIPSSRNPRYHAWSDEMYRFLGVGSKGLPKEGIPEQLINGVRVYVKPLAPPSGEVSRWSGKPVRNFQGLRVMAICYCGRHLPVGRLRQHKCGSKATKVHRKATVSDVCEHGYASGCRGCDPDGR